MHIRAPQLSQRTSSSVCIALSHAGLVKGEKTEWHVRGVINVPCLEYSVQKCVYFWTAP